MMGLHLPQFIRRKHIPPVPITPSTFPQSFGYKNFVYEGWKSIIYLERATRQTVTPPHWFHRIILADLPLQTLQQKKPSAFRSYSFYSAEIEHPLCFKLVTTLRQVLLFIPMDPIPTLNKTRVVYRIPWGECDGSYVAQIGRTLGQRIKKHCKFHHSIWTPVP